MRMTDMQPDYPAAHSMDTQFFAVDKDGNVAYFSTGEAGAAPEEALAGDQANDVARQLRQILPRCEVIHDRDGRRLPVQGEAAESHRPPPGLNYPVLMFLPTLDPVRADIAAGVAVPVPAASGAAVIWRQLTPERYDALANVGLRPEWHYVFGAFDGENDDLSSHGVFTYGHLTENWISGPYGRERVPARPIHVDQLPPALRGLLKSFAFDRLSFRDTAHIQPLEFGPCVSWESAWLDSGGNIRPVPGREEEYADQFEELVEGAGPFKVQPPDASS
jgi:hypothetical protein